MNMVDDFHGKNIFLSNFYMSPIEYEGIVYPSNEHAFQAAKTTSIDLRKMIAKLPTPGQSKRAGRGLVLRANWESIKISVMRQLIQTKFAKNTQLAKKLLETGDAELIEGNSWNDFTWGCVKQNGKWVGQNHLGKLLMEQRENLKMYNPVDIGVLVGKKITQINDGSDSYTFHTDDGKKYLMSHRQDCCESVSVVDIIGDLQDLVGKVVKYADSDCETPPGEDVSHYDSFTFTNFHLKADNIYVKITWLGTSNGYYGEGVDFEEV